MRFILLVPILAVLEPDDLAPIMGAMIGGGFLVGSVGHLLRLKVLVALGLLLVFGGGVGVPVVAFLGR